MARSGVPRRRAPRIAGCATLATAWLVGQRFSYKRTSEFRPGGLTHPEQPCVALLVAVGAAEGQCAAAGKRGHRLAGARVRGRSARAHAREGRRAVEVQDPEVAREALARRAAVDYPAPAELRGAVEVARRRAACGLQLLPSAARRVEAPQVAQERLRVGLAAEHEEPAAVEGRADEAAA